jgi:ABC-type phosphate/phosphonate transport system substrate-binding protein
VYVPACCCTSYADEARKHITIAISPCSDVTRSFTKFHPLITYLKHETGFDIRLVVPKDSAELERGVKHGDIDFAFQDPRMYVELAGLYDKGSLIIPALLSTCILIRIGQEARIPGVEHLFARVWFF